MNQLSAGLHQTKMNQHNRRKDLVDQQKSSSIELEPLTTTDLQLNSLLGSKMKLTLKPFKVQGGSPLSTPYMVPKFRDSYVSVLPRMMSVQGINNNPDLQMYISDES